MWYSAAYGTCIYQYFLIVFRQNMFTYEIAQVNKKCHIDTSSDSK